MKFVDVVRESVDYYQRGRDGLRKPGAEKSSFAAFQTWDLIHDIEAIRESSLEFLEANMKSFFIDPQSEVPDRIELAAFGLLLKLGVTFLGQFKKTETGWQFTADGQTIFCDSLAELFDSLNYPMIL